MLEALKDKWEKHKLSAIMIRDILMYMDRTYVQAQKKTPVYDRALAIFRDTVVRAPRIKERLLGLLLGLISRERSGERIERSVVKGITGMLRELGRDVYRADFEAPFLASSATFYQAESMEYLGQSSAVDYMKKAEERLAEETERVEHYLDESTHRRSRRWPRGNSSQSTCARWREMETSGIVAMLEDSKVADLARAYKLYRRVTAPESGLAVIRRDGGARQGEAETGRPAGARPPARPHPLTPRSALRPRAGARPAASAGRREEG